MRSGQKAGISLARALFNDAQIYLFGKNLLKYKLTYKSFCTKLLISDDPLSAVDATISKSMFNEYKSIWIF